MKVCTDACILGAWFAPKLGHSKRVLDIGAGTGLLMLMLAQETSAEIEGLEVEPGCFDQLQENLKSTLWKDRVTCHLGDIRNFSFNGKFDFIICNPPFYEKDLRSKSEEINLARHSEELSFEELVVAIDKFLEVDGSFGILLPYHRWEHFDELCSEKNFHLQQKIYVRHDAKHNPTRAILHYSREDMAELVTVQLDIHQTNSTGYTDDFVALLKKYYLYL